MKSLPSVLAAVGTISFMAFLLIISARTFADVATLDSSGKSVLVPSANITSLEGNLSSGASTGYPIMKINTIDVNMSTTMCQPFGKGTLCTTF